MSTTPAGGSSHDQPHDEQPTLSSAQIGAVSTRLASTLSSTNSLSADSAQEVTHFLSWLIDQQHEQLPPTASNPEGDAVRRDASAATAARIDVAVLQLGRAATAVGGSVALTSANLNVSARSVRPADLVADGRRAAVLSVPAAKGGRSAEVALPSSLLAAGGGVVNTSQPVALCLSSNAVNLYGGLTEGDHVLRSSSPLVGFSLLQGGEELVVRDLSERINISLPLHTPPTRGACFGRGSTKASSTRACASFIECRWWDAHTHSWSADGCHTHRGHGGHGAVCSCTHLTSFILFEFPTTIDELTEDLGAALSVNPLSDRAWQCLISPTPYRLAASTLASHSNRSGDWSEDAHAGWSTIPGVWIINGTILVLAIVSLSFAAQRDRKELLWIEGLVQGKLRERRRIGSTVGSTLLRRMSMRRESQTSAWRSALPVPTAQLPAAMSQSSMRALAVERAATTRHSPERTRAGGCRETPSKRSVLAHKAWSSSSGHLEQRSARAIPPATHEEVEAFNPLDSPGPRDPWTPLDSADPITVGAEVQPLPHTQDEMTLVDLGSPTRTPPPSPPNMPRHMYSDGGGPAAEMSILVIDDDEIGEDTSGAAMHAPCLQPKPSLASAGKARSYSPAKLGGALQRSGSRIHSLALQLRRGGSSHSSLASHDADATADAAELLPWQKARAMRHWKRARRQVTHVTLVRRWYADVNRPWKRLWLSFKESHTLIAGLLYRGSAGQLLPRLTRAQTVQILLNSLALELLVLCMLLSSPSDGPMVINPVKIIAAGSLAAAICIPGAMLSAALFAPMQLVRVVSHFFRRLLMLPFWLLRACWRCACRCVCGIQGNERVSPVTRTEGAAAFGEASASLAQSSEHEASEAHAIAHAPRKYSYVSLETYMVQSSLRRSLGQGAWRSALPVAFGWLANWAMMIGLMTVVSAYGCEFYSSIAEGSRAESFLLSWGWSVGQRFIVNEPALILVQKGVPMLFASSTFEHVCSESVAAALSLMVEGVVALAKSMRSMGSA